MNTVLLRNRIKSIKEYLAIRTEMVNHRDIIREVALGVDRSWIYHLMLLMAGLIALLGLLTNSVAVVIGAMLISPLMGPIISSGLALTIGDLPLARRAFRTIAVSVTLSILVSALVTAVSPLKEPTAEIMARVRPNIYDLFVAVLSGIVGAVALCTKRNYLITATGVAVATAVIPPLSVVGYGVGTGQLKIASGGFLLFFTNFVAIVLTSDLVFFIMGFRTSHVEAIRYSTRKRLLITIGLLALISIPLVHTLAVDLKNVNTKKRIERVLKRHLNRERASRMTGYTYLPRGAGLQVRATVNTVSFIGRQTGQTVEAELRESLSTPVSLHLEQVLVASEDLPQGLARSALLPDAAARAPRPDTPAEIGAKVGGMLALTEKELSEALAPFPLVDTRLTFSGAGEPLRVTAILRRDYPASDDERLLLSRQLERTLEQPVSLTLGASPLLPGLEFAADGTLAPQSVAALAILKRLPGGPVAYRFLLHGSRPKNGGQLDTLKRYLMGELNVPEQAITTSRAAASGGGQQLVTLRVLRGPAP